MSPTGLTVASSTSAAVSKLPDSITYGIVLPTAGLDGTKSSNRIRLRGCWMMPSSVNGPRRPTVVSGTVEAASFGVFQLPVFSIEHSDSALWSEPSSSRSIGCEVFERRSSIDTVPGSSRKPASPH